MYFGVNRKHFARRNRIRIEVIFSPFSPSFMAHEIINICRRLKPGGGGVNAAIFKAVGPALETATEERAGSLTPGKALVVPLPLTSPLCKNEGVTHVIHVLGPNMNPNRPNFLNNDYNKGCNILRMAYSSLFEGFASIITTQKTLEKGSEKSVASEMDQDASERPSIDDSSTSDQRIKREATYVSETNKKCKGLEIDNGNQNIMSSTKENANLFGTTDATKSNTQLYKHKSCGKPHLKWGSWAEALYHIAMDPKKNKNDVIEILDDVVVLKDLYPKVRAVLHLYPYLNLKNMMLLLLQAQVHLLVLARIDGLDCLADVGKEHLPLLRTMHAVGEKWANTFSSDDSSLTFRLGYHSVSVTVTFSLLNCYITFQSNVLRELLDYFIISICMTLIVLQMLM